jgi:hypothetical protein
MTRIYQSNTFWIVRRIDSNKSFSPCYYPQTLAPTRRESIHSIMAWVEGYAWFGKTWPDMRKNGFDCVKLNLDLAVQETNRRRKAAKK